MNQDSNAEFFKKSVLGHPSLLFVLFFTEMWERFSYYGMRAILVIFLTGLITGDNPGWGWTSSEALSLLGTYAMFVYLTPLLGGWLADNKIGYRMAVVIGALFMTLGHASMAVETPTFLYIGITLLIIGNGFFKPNMTSIISKMYEGRDDKKDGAYNIFYMGVNAGAFIGIMLCGWIGEKIGWNYGFGLAGIFMFLGMLQFYYAQPLFGNIGDKPDKKKVNEIQTSNNTEKLNPFLLIDYILIGIFIVCALIFIVNDPLSKIGNIQTFNFTVFGMGDSLFYALLAVISFIIVLIIRIPRYSKIVRDRMIAFSIFCLFTVFFWAGFEQGAGSLPIYTRDFTDRFLDGSAATIFKIIDLLVTVIPLAIITYVLINLFRITYKKIALSNTILGLSFIIIWGIVIYKLFIEFQSTETEIPVTWFAILNSLFIIVFAPLFTKWWDSEYNPPASVKYFLGLALLGIGFGFLAFGARNVPSGAETASLSIMWLVLAYLFHTLGELCLSPMGLSYLSKLIPARMIAFMFGVYYLAIAIGQKLAHYIGGDIDKITQEYSLSGFFLIFTIIPIILGVLSLLLHPLIKKLMHGIK
ncbi:MAG: peptide MFS transporter [Flavobacteriaceae bacterium]|jgi:proton-dependent oligopeptide transporter, POT family|nr:peptide MFS transporter [Flavobacteriaceae bacterium]MBT4113562.1 peptide MFS transporter [Flavobacteriaceae bacterium]MBT4614783.1 peptide MFS transporter [Flavobacteriaceae bacterium]MBT5246546.1 peptide MFS transporter [Flavobacteriaceae bacterium]MBT5649813.1 peptide MFS transporter [Flavobacteriaceae bacterium]